MEKNVRKTNGIVFISSYLPNRFLQRSQRATNRGLQSLHCTPNSVERKTPNSEELTSDCGEPQADTPALFFSIIHVIYFRPTARPLFAEFDAHNYRAPIAWPL